MAIDTAKYVVTEPGATGADAVNRAFENQVAYCRDNNAPITAQVCQSLLELLDTDRGGAVMEQVRGWQGAPLADALPLRVAGGLHALHLGGHEAALASLYEGQASGDPTDTIAEALERHEPFLLPWLDGPPQTNEAGRSSNFAAAFLWLVDHGLPGHFDILEIGSSAGINLMMRDYCYDLGGVRVGPRGARMAFKPEWRGAPPPKEGFDIVSAQGCDVAPVDLTDPEQALRLRAYIWPEFTERFARMDAAIEAALASPPKIAKLRALDFLREQLRRPQERGTTRVLMHSVVWQYIPREEREAIVDLMESTGGKAGEDTPLAWVSVEANRDTHRHELTVTYWPRGEMRRRLATAHPHGSWIEWAG
ncbi:DUF2332 domain-containing protein [Qipengyuania flava]|uniref:DUF2332 domain-containing protein n=1 Tax=Qipengyuania flava TaxID=192812 RepID=UPI001C630AC8|nr:DUF2332 domain-containing protein [Qipengyuania flava]QYJ08182.1 DUF2332 domain-containing protein [Qipengyuania flava]